MKKIISYSLWGSDTRYTHGALKNATLAKQIYPGWTCRFHVAECVPDGVLHSLSEFDNVEVLLRNGPGNWTGMFWRFEDASDNSVDVMLSRD